MLGAMQQPYHSVQQYHSVLAEQESFYRDSISVQHKDPGTIIKFLGWCHDLRTDFTKCIPAIVKIPFQVGNAIWNPLKFIRKKLVTPVLTKGFSYPLRPVTDAGIHGAQKLLFTEEELAKIPPQSKMIADMQKQQLSYAFSAGSMKLAGSYIDKIIAKLTSQLLKMISPSLALPNPKDYGNAKAYRDAIKTYKESIVKNISERFDGGNTFDYYQAGKKHFNRASLVYNLIDNTTAVLSLAYQFTDHYAKLPQQSFVFAMPMTRLKKTLMFAEILRRCADSYMRVVTHFKLDRKASKSIKIFNTALSYLLPFAKAVCPNREYIVGTWETTKLLYALYKEILQIQHNPEQHETIRTRAIRQYKMTYEDALTLEQALQDLPHRREEANQILRKYNSNLATFTFDLYKDNPKVVALRKQLAEQYHVPRHDISKLMLAMVKKDQHAVETIATQYNIPRNVFMEA